MTREPQIVHIVDDDDAVRDSLRVLLEVEGYTVRDYASGLSLLPSISTSSSGCILLDLQMPDIDGFEVIATLHKYGIDMPIIVLTGHGNEQIENRLLKSGVVRMLNKPVQITDILYTLNAALGIS